jgi:hypothetical protein
VNSSVSGHREAARRRRAGAMQLLETSIAEGGACFGAIAAIGLFCKTMPACLQDRLVLGGSGNASMSNQSDTPLLSEGK